MMFSRKLVVIVVSMLLISLLMAACAPNTSEFPTGKFYVSGTERTEGFEFDRSGSFNYFTGNDKVMEGTYTVEGDVYTETSNNVESAEPACKLPSTYNWVYDGTTLRFTVIEDRCPDRRSAYTDYLFVK